MKRFTVLVAAAVMLQLLVIAPRANAFVLDLLFWIRK